MAPNPACLPGQTLLCWQEQAKRALTIAAAGGIPGKSLVEIDCIAHR